MLKVVQRSPWDAPGGFFVMWPVWCLFNTCKLRRNMTERPKPYSKIIETPQYTLYLGDCREILPTLALANVDLVTDPPYGENIGAMNFAKSIKGGVTPRNDYRGMADWDGQRGDIPLILNYGDIQIIWGGNFYSDILPVSRGWIIWDKKNGGQFSNDFADCEMAWTSLDMPTRLIRHVWHVMIQQDMGHKEQRFHPAQKPLAVMKRCIGYTSSEIILDPYAGSGTTGVACMLAERKFIGIESDERYFEIMARRIRQAALQTVMSI